ncbi:MAG: 4'-phosphopantetheinyl transferase superfamily protein [Clostridiales Family XIII bacterium]|jgi:phosphopantetheine--protein transferase-like protein|nr:4'-phosphopantetheinyl transferase superfamily protein [Clostridiales Family XIII bacterium]
MILYVCENANGATAPDNAEGLTLSERLLRKASLDYAQRRGIDLGSEPEFRLARNSHGKPYFDEPSLFDVHFSLSHSGRYWAALFHGTPVGCDIEDISASGRRGAYASERFERIAARVFSPDEREYVARSEGSVDVKERFFEIWTRKEAYMKYTGMGFSQMPERFSTVAQIPGVDDIRPDGRVYDERGQAVRGVALSGVFIGEDVRCAYCRAADAEVREIPKICVF